MRSVERFLTENHARLDTLLERASDGGRDREAKETNALIDRMRAMPDVPVAPHYDGLSRKRS